MAMLHCQIVWRHNPCEILQKYIECANDYQENQITIIYDTMWNGTKKVAEKIAEAIREGDPDVTIKLFNLPKNDENDVATEVFKSKMLVLGSPTINRSILRSVAGFAHFLKELKFKNKKSAAFACYGWSGEYVKELNELLENGGFELVNEGLRVQWNPSD